MSICEYVHRVIESGLVLSPLDIEAIPRMTIAEFAAWQRGAAKRVQLQIALNGDIIATIINMLTTGRTLYTREDIYPSQHTERAGTDFERILRERFGVPVTQRGGRNG